MYNLAKILYEEEKKEGEDHVDSINLLESSQDFFPSKLLLFLISGKTHQYIDLENIQNILRKNDKCNEKKIHDHDLCNEIKLELFDINLFDDMSILIAVLYL